MKRLILKAGEEGRLQAGHPWVFDNEVAKMLGPKGPSVPEPGELVDVESARKEYIGRAFYNPHSKIVGRIYSPSKEGVDKGFFKRRIREALQRRQYAYDLERESARIVFAEADFLPGLIVDRYVGWPLSLFITEMGHVDSPLPFEDVYQRLGSPSFWLTVQFLSFGMDLRKGAILTALREVLGIPAGIVERDDVQVRTLEGLPQQAGILEGEEPEQGILIYENGIPIAINLSGGQKTGYFLDQRDNRRRSAAFASRRRVLDMCCHTGGFAIHAARAGASMVLAADSSTSALAALGRNAELNAVQGTVSPIEGDVFHLLKDMEKDKERFGLIILDPPAFAKTRSALQGAIKGYKEINLRALGLLNPGGVLVSCSCSHAMDEFRFRTTIEAAAVDAGKRIQLLDFRYQAPDHPILAGYPESLYLKCAYYRLCP